MKKWILLGFLLILFVSSGIVVYTLSQPSGKEFSDEEKEERLEQILGRDVRLTNNTPQGDTYYDGKTISFAYPAKAKIYEYRENSTSKKSSAFDDFSFDMTNSRIIFNLKVTPSNALSLDDVPAVRLRESRGEYQKEETKLDGINGFYYFKEKDGPEISAFFLNGKRLYVISITGSSYKHLKALFDNVLATAKLK